LVGGIRDKGWIGGKYKLFLGFLGIVSLLVSILGLCGTGGILSFYLLSLVLIITVEIKERE